MKRRTTTLGLVKSDVRPNITSNRVTLTNAGLFGCVMPELINILVDKLQVHFVLTGPPIIIGLVTARQNLVNHMILVEMIQCPGSGGTHAVVQSRREPDSEFVYGSCVWCAQPVFSDLKVQAIGAMARFTDRDGHLWMANQRTYIIQEEPF